MSKPASGSAASSSPPRRAARYGSQNHLAGGWEIDAARARPGLTQKKGELLMDKNLFQIEELESRLEMVSVEDISCECTCTCTF
jgi:hypothetical protein